MKVRFLGLKKGGQSEVGSITLNGGSLDAEGSSFVREIASKGTATEAWLKGLPKKYTGTYFRAEVVDGQKNAPVFMTKATPSNEYEASHNVGHEEGSGQFAPLSADALGEKIAESEQKLGLYSSTPAKNLAIKKEAFDSLHNEIERRALDAGNAAAIKAGQVFTEQDAERTAQIAALQAQKDAGFDAARDAGKAAEIHQEELWMSFRTRESAIGRGAPAAEINALTTAEGAARAKYDEARLASMKADDVVNAADRQQAQLLNDQSVAYNAAMQEASTPAAEAVRQEAYAATDFSRLAQELAEAEKVFTQASNAFDEEQAKLDNYRGQLAKLDEGKSGIKNEDGSLNWEKQMEAVKPPDITPARFNELEAKEAAIRSDNPAPPYKQEIDAARANVDTAKAAYDKAAERQIAAQAGFEKILTPALEAAHAGGAPHTYSADLEVSNRLQQENGPESRELAAANLEVKTTGDAYGRAEDELNTATQAWEDHRVGLLNDFAKEAGPEYFRAKAENDPDFYEKNMDELRGAWIHIGGDDQARVRMAAAVAFENENLSVFDKDLGRFVTDKDYTDKANAPLQDQFKTVLWAGLLQREYVHTQEDIKAGKLDGLVGEREYAAGDDSPESTWEDDAKYDENDAQDDWYQSDVYQELAEAAGDEAWSDMSAGEKFELLGINAQSQATMAYIEDQGPEAIKEALGADYKKEDEDSLTDDEVKQYAYEQESSRLASRARREAEATFDKPLADSYKEQNDATTAGDKRLAQDKTQGIIAAQREAGWAARTEATKGLEEKINAYDEEELSSWRDDLAEANRNENMESFETYETLERVVKDVNTDTVWAWASDKSLKELGISSAYGQNMSLEEKAQENFRENWTYDGGDEGFSDWFEKNKEDFKTPEYEKALEDYANAQTERAKTEAEKNAELGITPSKNFDAPSVSGRVELARGVTANVKAYTPSAVESYAKLGEEWGGEQIKGMIPVSRVLVFQGARDWKHAGRGSMGMTEFEVMVLSHQPKWYQEWFKKVRANADAQSKDYLGAVHSGDGARDTRGRCEAERHVRSWRTGREWRLAIPGAKPDFAPKAYFGILIRKAKNPKSAQKGNYWAQLQIRLVRPWESDYRAEYMKLMDDLRVVSTGRVDSGNNTPFDLREWKRKSRVAMRPIYADMWGAAVQDMKERSRSRKIKKGARPYITDDMIDDLTERVGGTIETTYETLERVVKDGVERGLDTEEMVKEFDAEWDDIYDNGRFDTIAATETNSTVQLARHSLYDNVEMIEWASQRDLKVRDTHVIYDEAGPLPYGYNFAKLVGESYLLRFPMDPECEEAGEIVNCRCTDMPSDEEFEGTEADLLAILGDTGEIRDTETQDTEGD